MVTSIIVIIIIIAIIIITVVKKKWHRHRHHRLLFSFSLFQCHLRPFSSPATIYHSLPPALLPLLIIDMLIIRFCFDCCERSRLCLTRRYACFSQTKGSECLAQEWGTIDHFKQEISAAARGYRDQGGRASSEARAAAECPDNGHTRASRHGLAMGSVEMLAWKTCRSTHCIIEQGQLLECAVVVLSGGIIKIAVLLSRCIAIMLGVS
jgi:hypothetical protein